MSLTAYDVILTQVSANGADFSEKFVHLNKGDILTVNSSHEPIVLPIGADGYILVPNASKTSGLEWKLIPDPHQQGTDAGTTQSSFAIDSDGYDVDVVAESATKVGLKTHAGTYADLEAKDIIANSVSVTAAPTLPAHLTNKGYVDSLLSTNDAMIFKGTVGDGGTLTIAAFNALATYDTGWSYKVIENGTIKGAVCEIGDMVIAAVDRAGSSNVDGDWVKVQTNIDGAVVGPAATTDNYVALFSGGSGKLLKAGSGILGSGAYATISDYVPKALFTEQGDIIFASGVGTPAALAHGAVGDVLQSGGNGANPSWLTLGTMAAQAASDYVTKALYDAYSILYADSDNTPAALTIGTNTLVGRKSSGGIVALTQAEVLPTIYVSAPSAFNSDGTIGQESVDGNFAYRCVTTGTTGSGRWVRNVVASVW